MKKSALLLIVLLSIGCATKPIVVSDISQVTPSFRSVIKPIEYAKDKITRANLNAQIVENNGTPAHSDISKLILFDTNDAIKDLISAKFEVDKLIAQVSDLVKDNNSLRDHVNANAQAADNWKEKQRKALQEIWIYRSIIGLIILLIILKFAIKF